MATLPELMAAAAANGHTVIYAEDGTTLGVDTLTVARLWTRAADDNVLSGYLGRDLRDASVVLEPGGDDVVRIGRHLRYDLMTRGASNIHSTDALERLCIAGGCTQEVASQGVDTCEDHLSVPLRIVALRLESGSLARPEGCTDDETAVAQLSREHRMHRWSEDIAKRELQAAGERRTIGRLQTPVTS